jgi:ABC-type ATPase with predicted acetyltransferase domain
VKFSVSKKFSTEVERTPRVIEVTEPFGLGLDAKEFVLYDDFEIEVEQGDVVYITGQSGSGKSVLLRQIIDEMKMDYDIADIDEVKLPEVPLVDQVGETTKEALELLSRVGLNDAYLFIRKPSELSDGQRYRLRLAHLMNMNVDMWVADEFGAVLDRVTAKVVAFSMQQYARKLGKTLVVATTHTDLEEELAANLTIRKFFRDKVEKSQSD